MPVAIGHHAPVPRPIETMTPEAYCEARAAKSGSSFYYSFRLLPPERRAAITALYAFCREVDDVVDECSEPALAAIKLKWWDEEIDRAYDGRPEHPVGQALAAHAPRYDLPRDVLHEIVAGMAMDLTRHRYVTRTTPRSPTTATTRPAPSGSSPRTSSASRIRPRSITRANSATRCS
jgi:hypothetical protein